MAEVGGRADVGTLCAGGAAVIHVQLALEGVAAPAGGARGKAPGAGYPFLR